MEATKKTKLKLIYYFGIVHFGISKGLVKLTGGVVARLMKKIPGLMGSECNMLQGCRNAKYTTNYNKKYDDEDFAKTSLYQTFGWQL
ncbi:MAG: hypothetical protein LBE39_02625 [Flavobacteriaceae bacterium]|nr:hypothetical protein [Flavobacteriaceae bacterium]